LQASVEQHRSRAKARPTGRKRTSVGKRSTSKTPAKRTAKSSASKRRSA
jgi:hypothetical protein